jgi:hypothetical protein
MRNETRVQSGDLISGELDLCHGLSDGPIPVVSVLLPFLVTILITAALGWVRQTRIRLLRSVATSLLATLVFLSMLVSWHTGKGWVFVRDAESCRPLGPGFDASILVALNVLVIGVPYLVGRWRRSLVSSG